MPVNVAQLVVSVGANTAMAEQGIMGLARMLGTGGPLALGAVGVGVAMAGVVAGSIDMAAKFQTQLTQLVTGAGEAQSNLGLISAGVLQMARDTGTSTKQLTDGLYMIESANIHGAGALTLLKVAAEGAKVGNADLGTTAQVVTGIIKDYGLKATDAAMAMNTVIATVSNGQTHMQDLATSLSSVLPTAAAAGVSLTDVMAAMAAQTAHMVPAADAATHLRQLIIALVAPSSAAKKALEGVGLTTDQVAAAMKTSLPGALSLIEQHVADMYGRGSPQYVEALKNISGGMREMQGMLLLTSKSGMADFKNDVTAITKQVAQGGNQIQGWTLVQGTFNQKMSELGQIFNTVMITLGTQLLPIATQFATFLANSLSPIVDGLTGKNKDFSKGLGGDLLKAAKDVSGFFKSDVQPIMKQLGDLWTNTIVPILHTLAEVFLKNILPAVEPVAKQFAEKVYPPMLRIAKDVLPALNPLLQGLGWLFQNVIGPALGQSVGFLGFLLGALADLADAISNFMHKPEVKAFFDHLGALANTVSHGVGGFFNSLPHFAEGGTMANTGFALVGEQGPELVTLPGGAQITPIANTSGANDTLSLPPGYGGYGGASAGANTQQTIIIQLDGRTLSRQVVKYLPSTIRLATGGRSV